MKKNNTFIVLVVAASILIMGGAGYALYMMGMKRGTTTSNVNSEASANNSNLGSIAAGEAATRRHIKDGLKAGG